MSVANAARMDHLNEHDATVFTPPNGTAGQAGSGTQQQPGSEKNDLDCGDLSPLSLSRGAGSEEAVHDGEGFEIQSEQNGHPSFDADQQSPESYSYPMDHKLTQEEEAQWWKDIEAFSGKQKEGDEPDVDSEMDEEVSSQVVDGCE